MIPQSDHITLTAVDIDAAALLLEIDHEEDVELAMNAADAWRGRAVALAIVAAVEFVALAWAVLA